MRMNLYVRQSGQTDRVKLGDVDLAVTEDPVEIASQWGIRAENTIYDNTMGEDYAITGQLFVDDGRAGFELVVGHFDLDS